MIKYLVMDVDGTLTDGKLYFSRDGELFKVFNIKDGGGIKKAKKLGIEPIIITGRMSDIVLKRCRELDIEYVFQGVEDKLVQVAKVCTRFDEVAYIGDDSNDFLCMKRIKEENGIVGCPRDAVEEVKEISHFVASHIGGDGAVREFIEWMINQVM